MARSLELKRFDVSLAIKSAFNQVHSNEHVPATKGISSRKDFKDQTPQGKWDLQPVIVSRSEFVPNAMISHLMRNKKDSALGVKYRSGDKITNMEGALHTFVTPVCPITILGDYIYKWGHSIVRLPENLGRRVILSAAVQPDYESSGSGEVIMQITELQRVPLVGAELPADFQPLWNQSLDDQKILEVRLNKYEELLRKYMIYILTKDHRLPAMSEVQDEIMTYSNTIGVLQQLIKDDKTTDYIECLHNRFVRVYDHVLSLEVLFMIYVHQLRNEFSVLEQLLSQGYVYTINPPSIFAGEIGGAENVRLLNRLQILAFSYLQQSSSFENLRSIGFSGYADKGAVPLLKHVFPEKTVVDIAELFKRGHYSVENSYALVLHNNSDAFGQNIETEGPSSLDGVIGTYSDAACQLQRQRKDLVDIVI